MMFFYKSVQNLVIIAVISKFALLAHSRINSKDSYYFTYAIDTKDIISQHTEHKSNDVVLGSYSFLQPDGKIRDVQYQIKGNSGFRAYVKYRMKTDRIKGHLRYPIDFQHPIRFMDPVSTIPRNLLEPGKFGKKHH